MKYKLQIVFWHGVEQRFIDSLRKIFPEIVETPERDKFNSYAIPAMSLDEFYSRWKDKFMVLKDQDENSNTLLICITQFGNFGQR